MVTSHQRGKLLTVAVPTALPRATSTHLIELRGHHYFALDCGYKLLQRCADNLGECVMEVIYRVKGIKHRAIGLTPSNTNSLLLVGVTKWGFTSAKRL